MTSFCVINFWLLDSAGIVVVKAYKRAATRVNRSTGFPIRPDTYQAVQQNSAISLNVWI